MIDFVDLGVAAHGKAFWVDRGVICIDLQYMGEFNLRVIRASVTSAWISKHRPQAGLETMPTETM